MRPASKAATLIGCFSAQFPKRLKGTSFIMRNAREFRRKLAYASAVTVLFVDPPIQAQSLNNIVTAGPEIAGEEITGKLANGTSYQLFLPKNWNGVLILDADLPGGQNNRDGAVFRGLHMLGYATGGKARDITGWRIREGSTDLVQLKSLFVDRWGAPQRTIVTGRSLGGLVARDAGETYADHFDGVVPACGGGAGLIAMWNQRFDVAFVIKTLLAPNENSIELVRVSDDQRNERALEVLANGALQSPAGRARLALIAAVGQLSGWPSGRDLPPAFDDYETRLATIASSAAGMLNMKIDVESAAGGVINFNVGVDYEQLFELADFETKAMAVDLYAQAGLSLADDFAKLAATTRQKADPSALAWARANGAISGRLRKPTLVLYTAVDPRAPLSEFRAYQRSADEAGAGGLLRQIGVNRSGHCVFSALERINSLVVMDEITRSGEWVDISPKSMNDRAAELSARLGDGFGEAKFASFADAPGYPRFFNASTPIDRAEIVE